MGKQVLASGGFVLSDEDMQVHVDPGPGALVRAKQYGVNVRNTDMLLVSRLDVLHAGDLNAVIEGMTVGGMDHKGVLLCPHGLVSESESSLLGNTQKGYLERVIALRVGDKVGISTTNIFPAKTHDPEETHLGYIIVTPRYCIGYVAATEYSATIVKQYKGCDILIVNVHALGSAEEDIERCVSLIQGAKPRAAILTGFGIKMVQHDILSSVRKIHRETEVQTIAAKDGLTVNPLSYAAKTRQKSLQPI
jgi:hypothetical protein